MLYNVLFMLIVILTRYLFLVSGAPTFVSRPHLLFQYWRQLYYQVQSEAFFAIDRFYRSPESFLCIATTFYSVQAFEGGGQTRSDACTPRSNLFPLLLFPVSYSKVGSFSCSVGAYTCFPHPAPRVVL